MFEFKEKTKTTKCHYFSEKDKALVLEKTPAEVRDQALKPWVRVKPLPH